MQAADMRNGCDLTLLGRQVGTRIRRILFQRSTERLRIARSPEIKQSDENVAHWPHLAPIRAAPLVKPGHLIPTVLLPSDKFNEIRMEQVFRAKLNNEGRLNIPAACRQRLGFQPGQEVLMQVSNGQLLVYTQEQTLKRLQDWVAAAVPSGVSLVDGLNDGRRMEAGRSASE